jgi:hypothetical protein
MGLIRYRKSFKKFINISLLWNNPTTKESITIDNKGITMLKNSFDKIVFLDNINNPMERNDKIITASNEL